MIQISALTLDLSDPLVLAALVATAVLVVLFWLLIAAARRAARTVQTVDSLAGQLGQLGDYMQALGNGQSQLAGNIQTVSDAQASAQTRVIQTVETRLAQVNAQVAEKLADNALKSARSMFDLQERMKETLTGSSEKSTKQLTELQERLATIDRAQSNIEKLSGDVLSLQDILSNKQRRGLFGEIQLTDIVSKALPTDSYTLQHTLTNGKRADCLVHLPNPPGPIVIDAKFPFEAYEALARAPISSTSRCSSFRFLRISLVCSRIRASLRIARIVFRVAMQVVGDTIQTRASKPARTTSGKRECSSA